MIMIIIIIIVMVVITTTIRSRTRRTTIIGIRNVFSLMWLHPLIKVLPPSFLQNRSHYVTTWLHNVLDDAIEISNSKSSGSSAANPY